MQREKEKLLPYTMGKELRFILLSDCASTAFVAYRAGPGSDHSRLQTWMRRFNGVATKYLANT
ncbi:MAG: hypothetical protein KAH98_05715, partial [Dehalococcoidia bacterium]|nr:hypothetical protein [Dehalococcoidia bacterium]